MEELGRDPVGRYVAGETYVHFCAQPSLWGILLIGRPTSEHALELKRSLALAHAPPARPHVTLVDARGLLGGEEAAFGLLERYMVRHSEELSTWVRRFALVRPLGFGGALVAGVYEVMHRPYPVAVFDELLPALAWLAEAEPLDPPAPVVAEQIAALIRATAEAAPILSSLRRLIDENLSRLTLAEAARALSMSERTLQRRLAEAHASFQEEVADARVRAAKRRLTATDDPVSTIAFDVGCASPQHLNVLFRRKTGQSPGEFRRTTRGG